MTTDKVTYTIESGSIAMREHVANLITEIGNNTPVSVDTSTGDTGVTATVIGDGYELPLIEDSIRTSLPASLQITDTDVTIGADRSADV
ncbi:MULTISPECIES: hypothetical protein [Haloferacaceae]|uniref:Uncharacterized protein n=2 Tax=Haloferacaceae TaxID=1644056 RepID=A0ABD6DCH6_9EURY|nr:MULTISPECIES: hypothetical protein [Halorubraceae]CDK38112.1 hypothetical protein BN903_312 [Halorubrum sp. AJ67]